MRVSLLVAVVPLSLLLTACEPRSEMDASASRASTGPLRRLNPAPKQGYRIRLTIQDAPGPLVLVGATAQYDVVNEIQCGEASPYGGVYRMTSGEPFVITQVDGANYEGVVYFDQILDGDYYGNGACVWELTAVTATFTGVDSGSDGVRFSPSIFSDRIRADGSEVVYFWKGTYANPEFGSYTSSGQTDPTRINRGRDELFVITFDAKELRQ
ncbi:MULTISPECIES: hypothetical protein [unclassified Pseudoxanthomonas]|uniref:hypothetical protein n=1 Tax=unclassified Pseudoxanthomonas TaxID=2645906 RepID=UPI0008E1BC25|nr:MULTISPECIES: hypothetical protein [unclassified Pseudoxanthomonas]SFV29409.1 hypothetical protein SAMN05428990_1300 [Pseudoxanthomonas sp. YR558]